MNSASTPHNAVISAIQALLLIDQEARTRAVRSGGDCSSRYVEYSGLYTAQVKIKPNSTAITITSPATPGRIATSPITQQARAAPVTRMSLRCPKRAASGRAMRAPTSPPMLGTAKARPYCHAGNPNRPSIRTASSGSVAMIRPLTRIVLKKRGRSASLPRMQRQPSNRSADFRPGECPSACSGLASAPPIARIPHADSRKLTASATIVVTGPNTPISRPPIGGPSTREDQFADSKRVFAVSRSSGCTSDLTNAPLAALNAMSAAPSITATTSSCGKLSHPNA